MQVKEIVVKKKMVNNKYKKTKNNEIFDKIKKKNSKKTQVDEFIDENN